MAIDSFDQYQLIQSVDQDGKVIFYITRNAKRISLNFHNLFKADSIFNHYKK